VLGEPPAPRAGSGRRRRQAVGAAERKWCLDFLSSSRYLSSYPGDYFQKATDHAIDLWDVTRPLPTFLPPAISRVVALTVSQQVSPGSFYTNLPPGSAINDIAIATCSYEQYVDPPCRSARPHACFDRPDAPHGPFTQAAPPAIGDHAHVKYLTFIKFECKILDTTSKTGIRSNV